MARIAFFLLLAVILLVFISPGSGLQQILVVLFVFVVGYYLLKVVLDLWLHRKKRREDREAYTTILGRPRVRTISDLVKYARIVRNSKAEEKNRGDRNGDNEA